MPSWSVSRVEGQNFSQLAPEYPGSQRQLMLPSVVPSTQLPCAPHAGLAEQSDLQEPGATTKFSNPSTVTPRDCRSLRPTGETNVSVPAPPSSRSPAATSHKS